MSNSLKETIQNLANQFAQGVTNALRECSLQEILEMSAEAHKAPAVKRGRPRRASAIESVVNNLIQEANAGGKASKPAKAPKAAKSGRLARRSTEEISQDGAKVTALLAKKGGLRAEQIRSLLDIDKRALPKVMAHLKETKQVKVTGQKRSTTYTLAKLGNATAKMNGAAIHAVN